MRQRITNICASTPDVLCFSFESAGALEIVNGYSGYDRDQRGDLVRTTGIDVGLREITRIRD
jgi:hypothetical protein